VTKRCRSLLPAILIAEILRRLALNADNVPGNSIRAICREMNVNRQTVRALDRGEYGFEHRQFQRCKCGHTVLMPCQICLARVA
jgi:hypothetical protein